jgi:hypothetical protein
MAAPVPDIMDTPRKNVCNYPFFMPYVWTDQCSIKYKDTFTFITDTFQGNATSGNLYVKFIR